MNASITPRRYLIELQDPIDKSWRPLIMAGKTRDFDTPGLAAVFARGYGKNCRVKDRKETEA